MTEGDVLRRLDALEQRVERIHDTHPSDAVVQAQLAAVHSEIAALRRDLGAAEQRIEGLSGRIDRLRERWETAAAATRNRVYAVLGVVISGLMVTLMLRGLGQIGGP